MDPDDIDLFAEETDVTPTRTSLARVLLTLAGAGVLVAIVVIILATLATAGRPEASVLCGGAPSCTDLTVTQIAQLTALELPQNATVLESRYESGSDEIVVEATVRLPIGSENPFEGGTYFAVDTTPFALPAGTEPFGFYAATGELGALTADGALVDDGTNEIVVVRVLRIL